MKLIKNSIILFFAVVLSLTTTDLKAQDFGADVVSSYVWRGTQFGTGPVIQPWFTLPTITDALELGVWGSFPVAGGDQTYELDLYASYDFGPLALTVTNYTFPGATGAYGDDYGLFDGDLEVTASGSIGAIGLSLIHISEPTRPY